tara:strand:+ start:304 stop:573 length:270 start_codon:yes stop_codon:yes gene_type:complete
MSSEVIIKKDLNKIKFYPHGSEKFISDPQISNINLNKVKKINSKKKRTKICINILHEKLRKKEVKEKFENRMVLGLFVSAVAVLFYVST